MHCTVNRNKKYIPLIRGEDSQKVHFGGLITPTKMTRCTLRRNRIPSKVQRVPLGTPTKAQRYIKKE